MNSYEFILAENTGEINGLSDYYWFCKIYCNYFGDERKIKWNKKNRKIENEEEIKKNFEFVKNIKLIDYKNTSFELFSFEYLKNEIINKNGKTFEFSKNQAEKHLNINKNNLKNLINNSIPYSFGIWMEFKLKQPYFSRDDEEFYLIQNPVLKEKVFKVPMIRGSGWKGALANAGRELIKEKYESENYIWKDVFSYLRIFGTGNEDFRNLMDMLNKHNYDELKKSLIRYVLFNLGAPIKLSDLELNDGIEEFIKKYFNEFENKFLSTDNKKYYETKKGRAVFYPTYFDKLSLEVINPHSRKTRAGTNPIHYEVVPKDTEGILQIVYIPFDGILKKNEELKKEVEQDLEFLCNCIEKVADLGIGAKTKLGWGTFEFLKENDDNDLINKFYGVNRKISEELKDKLENMGWKECL